MGVGVGVGVGVGTREKGPRALAEAVPVGPSACRVRGGACVGAHQTGMVSGFTHCQRRCERGSMGTLAALLTTTKPFLDRRARARMG
jgi:hypothetical protein